MIPDERRLVERLQAGDPEALGELYRQHATRIYGFALRRLGDPSEAEDVRQDVFIEVAGSIARFEGRSSLSTWLFAIASHEVASRRRRRDREPLLLDESLAFLRDPARDARVESVVDALRMLARCSEVLGDEVAEPQRVVFELHARGARDLAAIARVVGRSSLAIRISLLRTRRHLTARVAGLRDVLNA